MRLRSEMIALVRKIHQPSDMIISDDDYEEVLYATREEIAAGIPEATEDQLDRIMAKMRERFAARHGGLPDESPTIN